MTFGLRGQGLISHQRILGHPLAYDYFELYGHNSKINRLSDSESSGRHGESHSESDKTRSDSYDKENSEFESVGGSEGTVGLNDDLSDGPSWEPSNSSVPVKNYVSDNEEDYQTLSDTPEPSEKMDWQSEYSSDSADYAESDHSAGYDAGE
jgi:hypothetical protein